MTAILFDYVQRAAEAFVAANRASDPELGARLRQTAYGFLELIHDREEELRRSGGPLDHQGIQWGDVLPKPEREAGKEEPRRRFSQAAMPGDADE